MLKKKYTLRSDKLQNSLAYQDARFKYIMFVKCLEEGRDPVAYAGDAWKQVGNEHYGWFESNQSIDVNVAPVVRHDLYKGNKNSYWPELLASIMYDEKMHTYHCYKYDSANNTLERFAEVDSLEDAKSCIEVLCVMGA